MQIETKHKTKQAECVLDFNSLPVCIRVRIPVRPDNFVQDYCCTCFKINFSERQEGSTVSSSTLVCLLSVVVVVVVMCNSTVNICAIDLTKAFDKVNHSVLYMKLMKRLIPNALLEVLENWMSSCLTCVKWSSSWSHFFSVDSGVRQGAVLSPFLFAVCVDKMK